MQIDIGFGDVMTPGPETLTYPTILDFSAPTLSGYSRETVVAEKLQALVQLRMLNTRMKDYFDLWLLTRQPELNKQVPGTAINRTFANRGMVTDTAPIGLSAAFGGDAFQADAMEHLTKAGEAHSSTWQPLWVVKELQFFAAILPLL